METSFSPNFFNETTSVAESKPNALNLITSLFIFKLGNKVGVMKCKSLLLRLFCYLNKVEMRFRFELCVLCVSVLNQLKIKNQHPP